MNFNLNLEKEQNPFFGGFFTKKQDKAELKEKTEINKKSEASASSTVKQENKEQEKGKKSTTAFKIIKKK